MDVQKEIAEVTTVHSGLREGGHSAKPIQIGLARELFHFPFNFPSILHISFPSSV